MSTYPSKKLFDVVRETSDSSTIPTALSKATSIGLSARCFITAKGIWREMGTREILDFSIHLAVEGRVAASTQNQADNRLIV